MDYKYSESKGTVCVCVCVCLKEKERGLGVTSVRRPRTEDYTLCSSIMEYIYCTMQQNIQLPLVHLPTFSMSKASLYSAPPTTFNS